AWRCGCACGRAARTGSWRPRRPTAGACAGWRNRLWAREGQAAGPPGADGRLAGGDRRLLHARAGDERPGVRGRPAGARFGEQKINLHEAGHEFAPKAKVAVPGSADLCFVVEGGLAPWLEHLAELGVPVV